MTATTAVSKHARRFLAVVAALATALVVAAPPASAASGSETVIVPIVGTPCSYVITVHYDTEARPPATSSGTIVCDG